MVSAKQKQRERGQSAGAIMKESMHNFTSRKASSTRHSLNKDPRNMRISFVNIRGLNIAAEGRTNAKVLRGSGSVRGSRGGWWCTWFCSSQKPCKPLQELQLLLWENCAKAQEGTGKRLDLNHTLQAATVCWVQTRLKGGKSGGRGPGRRQRQWPWWNQKRPQRRWEMVQAWTYSAGKAIGFADGIYDI